MPKITIRTEPRTRVKITISLGEIEKENAKAPRGTVQCPSWIGVGGIVFCLRREGHERDHRGLRAQWKESV